MKKHNCKDFLEEARGCSICSNILKGLRGKNLDEAIKKCNWHIIEQQKEINNLRKDKESKTLGEEAVGGDL